MNNKSEKLKSLIKGAKPTFGTDPNDPWSAKAGITEENLSEDELLNRYMRTRGINPKTASKISKISASKTGDFEKWKRDHVSGGRLPMVKKEEIDPGLTDVKGTINATSRRKKQLKMRKSLHTVVTTPGLRKEASLSDGAKLIKQLHDNRIHEDLYDHEKEDKSVATYGKKPKHDKTDPKESHGEKKPQAAAVLSGGKTLTGQKRDDIEIDPMMRVRPGQPDPTKDKDKDKDKKKQDNKKDK